MDRSLSAALPPRPRRSAARLATLFLALVCVSLLTVQGWSIYSSRAASLREAHVATQNVARAMADHADSVFDQVDSVLAGVIEQIRHDGLGAERARLREFLVIMAARTGPVEVLAIYDADGTWLLNSFEDPLPGPLDIGDRAYFNYHRLQGDLGTHIGAPVRSRTSGNWVIPVSRRLEHPDGRFAGVVLATVTHDYFRNYFERFDIGAHGVIALAGDDGKLIMRRPFAAADLESPGARPVAAADTMFARWQRQDAGGPEMVTGADGIKRRYAYEHLRSYPLLVGVGLAHREVLERWRQTAYLGAAGTAALLAALLMLGSAMIRQLLVRERLQRELRDAKSELEASNASLQELALSDGLTGLPNRRHFDQRLELEFKRSMREGTGLALIMLDVDYFKRFNDHHGHVEGDAALQEVATAIGGCLRRATDMGARFGGEEFTILLPDTDLEGALAVAEAARALLARRAIAHERSPFRQVTLSAGVAVLQPQPGQSIRLLLEAADQGLYEAKAQGRNRVAVAAPAP
ncbi:diguanylate cyclase domain-containing protein [Massilia sp. DWR3-1-1]|uniref:GGDEF domain-containing protein n=1 Tax=Massilia sp. DWR3-1-1 TaxID=2804559 RepID=UPI003CEE9ECD